MNGREFFDAVADHKELEWRDIIQGRSPEEDVVAVKHLPRDITMAISVKSILEQPWEELLAVVQGLRDPVVMIWMSRIVGYYGQIRNWNKSKWQELLDRHKGDYGVDPARVEQMKSGSAPVAACELV